MLYSKAKSKNEEEGVTVPLDSICMVNPVW
jgi:hypothetical protein